MNLHPLASDWLYWVKGMHVRRSAINYMYSMFGWSTLYITCDVVHVERKKYAPPMNTVWLKLPCWVRCLHEFRISQDIYLLLKFRFEMSKVPKCSLAQGAYISLSGPDSCHPSPPPTRNITSTRGHYCQPSQIFKNLHRIPTSILLARNFYKYYIQICLELPPAPVSHIVPCCPSQHLIYRSSLWESTSLNPFLHLLPKPTGPLLPLTV